MRNHCIVCSKLIDELIDVVVARCGHIFHGACLNRWLFRISSECPRCHRHLRVGQDVIKLYGSNGWDSFIEENTDGLKSRVRELEEEVKMYPVIEDKVLSLTKKVSENQAIMDEYEVMTSALRNKVALLKQDVLKMRREVEELSVANSELIAKVSERKKKGCGCELANLETVDKRLEIDGSMVGSLTKIDLIEVCIAWKRQMHAVQSENDEMRARIRHFSSGSQRRKPASLSKIPELTYTTSPRAESSGNKSEESPAELSVEVVPEGNKPSRKSIVDRRSNFSTGLARRESSLGTSRQSGVSNAKPLVKSKTRSDRA